MKRWSNRNPVWLPSVSLCLCGSIFLTVLAGAARANESAPAALEVFPPDVNLFTGAARQAFVVQAAYPDGLTRDVTAQAKAGLANPALARLERNVLTPLADGATELRVEFAGRSARVPVTVKDARKDRPISFKLDVMPIFMRAGCNAGSCHGAARGKDGFRLSLFGFDPDGDHYRLCREMNGRRINLALPAESLLVEKACGRVPHTGGKKISEGDEHYQTILRWLEADAPADPPTVAAPTAVEVFPPSALLDG